MGKCVLDLGDANNWPVSIKYKRYTYVSKNITISSNNTGCSRLTDKFVKEQVKYYNNFLNKCNTIDNFIIDLSYPTPTDRTYLKKSKYAPLNEFSWYDYKNNNIVKSGKGNVIISGSAKKAKEVLVLNEIKKNSIVRVLSFLEIDILYAIYDENNMNNFYNILNMFVNSNMQIKQISNYKICININNTNISLSPDEFYLYNDLYNNNSNMYDLTRDLYKNNNLSSIYDILRIYEKLKNIKRSFINKILKCFNFNILYPSIVEDEIFAVVVDNQCLIDNNKKNSIKYKECEFELESLDYNSSTNYDELCQYDVMLIGDNNEVITASDEKYESVCKEIVDKNMNVFVVKKGTNQIIQINKFSK